MNPATNAAEKRAALAADEVQEDHVHRSYSSPRSRLPEGVKSDTTLSNRHLEPQKPPGSILAFLNTWWTDIRFEQERRVVITLALVLLMSVLIVGILVISTVRSMREANALALSSAGNFQPVPAPSVMPVAGLLEQAGQLVVDGQLSEAAATLRSAEIALLRLQGIVAWKTGDPKSASKRFENALAIDPSSAPDMVNLAGIQLQQGNPAAAVALLASAQKTCPDDVYISNRYLLARIEAGDLAGVRNEIQTALALSPENSLERVAVPAAAIELSSGQYVNAANFLYAAKGKIPSGIFESLLNESPIAAFANRRELQPFFSARNGAAASRGGN